MKAPHDDRSAFEHRTHARSQRPYALVILLGTMAVMLLITVWPMVAPPHVEQAALHRGLGLTALGYPMLDGQMLGNVIVRTLTTRDHTRTFIIGRCDEYRFDTLLTDLQLDDVSSPHAAAHRQRMTRAWLASESIPEGTSWREASHQTEDAAHHIMWHAGELLLIIEITPAG